MSDVVFLTSDLMFSSQLLGAACTLGLKLALAAKPADLAQKLSDDCRLVLIDLTILQGELPSVVAQVRASAPTAKIIAFGPHVDETLLNSAQSAGCDLVLSRGQFHREYAALLKAC